MALFPCEMAQVCAQKGAQDGTIKCDPRSSTTSTPRQKSLIGFMDATPQGLIQMIQSSKQRAYEVSERSERALMKTSILAMNPANDYRQYGCTPILN